MIKKRNFILVVTLIIVAATILGVYDSKSISTPPVPATPTRGPTPTGLATEQPLIKVTTPPEFYNQVNKQ